MHLLTCLWRAWNKETWEKCCKSCCSPPFINDELCGATRCWIVLNKWKCVWRSLKSIKIEMASFFKESSLVRGAWGKVLISCLFIYPHAGLKVHKLISLTPISGKCQVSTWHRVCRITGFAQNRKEFKYLHHFLFPGESWQVWPQGLIDSSFHFRSAVVVVVGFLFSAPGNDGWTVENFQIVIWNEKKRKKAGPRQDEEWQFGSGQATFRPRVSSSLRNNLTKDDI